MTRRSPSACAKRLVLFVMATVALIGIAATAPQSARAADTAPSATNAVRDDSLDVIGAFNRNQDVDSAVVKIPDQKKRLVMFLMGVPLLIFILTTAGLGVAMGVYGKPVYVPHMIFAGLSVTLAIAHAVVGIVWFYPF